MSRKTALRIAAGVIAFALFVTTYWFWSLLSLGLFLLGVAVVIPGLGASVLQRLRWRELAVVGRLSGIAAAGVLVASSVAVSVAGSAVAPSVPPTPQRTAAATSQPKSTTGAASVATVRPSVAPAATGAREQAVVLEVIDGDTIRVRLAGRDVSVRYIGIDTPETVDPRRPVQCYAREASAYNDGLVRGKGIELEKDVSETDRFGRLLRYVWVDGRMVNEVLVRDGYASAVAYAPDVKYQDRLRALEAEARAAGRGLWGPACAASPSPTSPAAPTSRLLPPTSAPTTPVPALPTPMPTPLPTLAPTSCHPSYPDVCIPPPPPDLDCGDIPYRRFRVVPPDPHGFDGRDKDGIGCES